MTDHRHSIREATFPDRPGVYVVWEHPDDELPLYVGVAGTQTIAQRWRRQHLYPRAGGSALRRTLGLYLGLVATKLQRPDRYYPPTVEQAITAFLNGASIEFHPTSDAGEALCLERELIASMAPVLNVRGVRHSTTPA
jgi:GIY-YIG catalytic domain